MYYLPIYPYGCYCLHYSGSHMSISPYYEAISRRVNCIHYNHHFAMIINSLNMYCKTVSFGYPFQFLLLGYYMAILVCAYCTASLVLETWSHAVGGIHVHTIQYACLCSIMHCTRTHSLMSYLTHYVDFIVCSLSMCS